MSQQGTPSTVMHVVPAICRNLRCCVLVGLVWGLATSESVADELIGFTEPYRTVELSVSEPGVVSDINIERGQQVEAGQRLLSLDTSVLDATLAIAKQKAASSGRLDAAAAELQLRQGRLRQVQLLRQRGHATEQELRRALTDVEIADAKLQLAQEDQLLSKLECNRIQAQIERRRVVSPFDGMISDVHRELGESLVLANPTVITLIQLEQLRARFPATPQNAAQLKVGQEVKLVVQGAKRPVPAVVERISPVIDAKSGTLEIEVVMDNRQGLTRSGARCRLPLSGKPNTTTMSVSKRRGGK